MRNRTTKENREAFPLNDDPERFERSIDRTLWTWGSVPVHAGIFSQTFADSQFEECLAMSSWVPSSSEICVKGKSTQTIANDFLIVLGFPTPPVGQAIGLDHHPKKRLHLMWRANKATEFRSRWFLALRWYFKTQGPGMIWISGCGAGGKSWRVFLDGLCQLDKAQSFLCTGVAVENLSHESILF